MIMCLISHGGGVNRGGGENSLSDKDKHGCNHRICIKMINKVKKGREKSIDSNYVGNPYS